MDDERPRGVIENVAVLDLTSMRSPEDVAEIRSIDNVALVLVPESLASALVRVPTRGVASVVPVPDGCEVKVHTGTVVMGGDALADPADEDRVLVVTGMLALSSPVERVTYRRVIVTGMVLAPFGSEAALGAGLTRVTGSVQYYEHVEGQRFKSLTGQTRLSGEWFANAGGNPADVLFLSGQTIVTSPVREVGFRLIVAAGQLIAPRESEAVLAGPLQVQGQLAWYTGRPRFFVGSERFGRAFFEYVDEPVTLVLVGDFVVEPDVPPELLREKVSDVTLVGELRALAQVAGLLQSLATENHGRIVADRGDDDE